MQAKLKKDEESLGDLMKLKPEELLLRWFNYHLEKVGYDGAPIKNFGKDVAVRGRTLRRSCTA